MAMSQENDQYLTGKLLLAMPSIGDPRFDHAVIYMCAHDENGAMGLAINQKAPGIRFDKVLEQLGIPEGVKLNFDELPQDVMHGGPVAPGRGFLLHSGDFSHEETIGINDDYGVTGTLDALQSIIDGEGPADYLFILGYAGWEAGQLEDELKQNAWLVCDPDKDIIFHEALDDKWKKAVATLGFDPALLSGESGSA